MAAPQRPPVNGPGIAPAPQHPERAPQMYERKMAPSIPGNRGPLRFEEGVATDTDIPNGFITGANQGYQTAPGRPNHNMKVDTKYPQETVAERAHVGSAAWVEAPTFLGEFAAGSFTDYAEPSYDRSFRSGGHYMRLNPAAVQD